MNTNQSRSSVGAGCRGAASVEPQLLGAGAGAASGAAAFEVGGAVSSVRQSLAGADAGCNNWPTAFDTGGARSSLPTAAKMRWASSSSVCAGCRGFASAELLGGEGDGDGDPGKKTGGIETQPRRQKMYSIVFN